MCIVICYETIYYTMIVYNILYYNVISHAASAACPASSSPRALVSAAKYLAPLTYTQFEIQDSGLFGPYPWKFLAQKEYIFP